MKPRRIVDQELLETVRTLPCLCCGRRPSDAHHLTTRGAGGGDVATNLMPLCRIHHGEFHQRGPAQMIHRYPAIQYWLEGAGRTDILRHARLHEDADV